MRPPTSGKLPGEAGAGADFKSRLEFTFEFDPATIRIEPSPFGVLLHLPNGRQGGRPGGPALPIVVFEAVLPPDTMVRQVTFETQDDTVIAEGHVAPLQFAAPGVRLCNHFDRIRDDGLVEPLPKPKPVPPDPELYREAIELGKRTAELGRVDASGLQHIVAVTLRPVVLTANGATVLHTRIHVTLALEDARRPGAEDEPGAESARVSSQAQAERWVELTRSRVINPRDVIDLGAIVGYISRAEYLIITDNQRWDATTIAPLGPTAGDLVAEFERLAQRKRLKGMSARVVTISDIVGGRYGRFAGGCRRDLQEVLREFVKYAYANWGTAWLLLGGDIDIVPVRTVVGYVGGISPGTTNPPEPGNSYWDGTFLKMSSSVQADTPLIRTADGRRIPYDPAGTSSTLQSGWIFTVDDTYTTRSTMPTGFVRVNGPAAQVNTDLFWLTNENTIPTDLYYGDVSGYPTRSPNGTFVAVDGPFSSGLVRFCGGHDWDQVGNSLYGQWNGDGDLDGVQYRADISVGRAPVASALEAKTFVDKVLHYEDAGAGFFTPRWLNKLLMVSANWGGRSWFGPSNPLADNSYIKRAGDDHAVIQLATQATSFNYKLISFLTDADQRELPFRLDASAAVRGWRFAVSATDPSPSFVLIPFPWGSFQFPIPSRWIVAYGTAAEMTPQAFILDDAAADGSMMDQEALRLQLAADVPNWSTVRRVYEDEIDLPAGGGPPVEHLTDARVLARLNEGQHIVSLSGHGWWGGCCGLSPSMRTSLTNGGQTFIAYADSCSTNEFDVNDAISELLVQNEHGGAVAYVGNTRYSWIGVGDDFQRNFFKGLTATRALGLLNDRRLAILSAGSGWWQVYNRWSVFSLNLTGDPEMRIWNRRPRPLCIELIPRVRLDHELAVKALVDERAAAGVVVTASQEGFMRQARTDRAGFATFDLEGAKPGELSVTAYHRDTAPLLGSVEVTRPVWVEGTVDSIHASSEDETVVDLETEGGERKIEVPVRNTGLLALLGQGMECRHKVRVLLGEGDVVEAVELGNGHGAPELVGAASTGMSA